MGPLAFAFFATLIVLAALAVVFHPDPIYSALALVVVMATLAVFFVGLDAHIVAALQIIVYAGAVMVLFLFVIMLLGQPAPGSAWLARPALCVAGALAVAAFAASVASLVSRGSFPTAATPEPAFGTTAAFGTLLFTRFLLPFELTSLLLLIAVVGAVMLAHGRSTAAKS
jgi:NADH-quinone oxidoreductase subunit J